MKIMEPMTHTIKANRWAHIPSGEDLSEKLMSFVEFIVDVLSYGGQLRNALDLSTGNAHNASSTAFVIVARFVLFQPSTRHRTFR